MKFSNKQKLVAVDSTFCLISLALISLGLWNGVFALVSGGVVGLLISLLLLLGASGLLDRIIY